MFCTKCGYNAEDANFCPNCGYPINNPVSQAEEPTQPAQVVMEKPTPVVMEESVPPVSPVPPVAPVAPPVTPANSNNQNLTWNNENQKMWDTYKPAVKKKSKAPVIIGIVTALLVVIACVGVFLILPMLKEKKEEDAVADVNLTGAGLLKSVTAEFKSSFSSAVSSINTSKSSDKKKITGSYTLSNVVMDGEDYLSYSKVNTVNYVVEIDGQAKKIYLNMSLSSDSSTPVISMQAYTEGNTIYFRVPELLSSSLYVEGDSDMSSGSAIVTDTDWDSIAKLLSNMDENTMKQYVKVVETVIGHIVTGIDSVIDKGTYTKNEGTVNVSMGDLGSADFETYNVQISKTDIINGYNSVIDSIFDDATIVPYITMLSTVAGTIDKNEIKQEFSSEMTSAPETFKFTIYCKDDKFAGIGIKESDYEADGKAQIDFITTDENSIYFIIKKESEYIDISYNGKSENKIIAANCDIEGSYFKVYYEFKANSKQMEIVKFSMTAKNGSESVSFAYSAKASFEDISSVSVSSSDFNGAINVQNITEAQQLQIMTDISTNGILLLDKVLTQKGLDAFNSNAEESKKEANYY